MRQLVRCADRLAAARAQSGLCGHRARRPRRRCAASSSRRAGRDAGARSSVTWTDERPPRSLRSLPPAGAHSALRAAGRALKIGQLPPEEAVPYFIYRVFPPRRLEKVTDRRIVRRGIGRGEGAAREPRPSRRLRDQGHLRRGRDRGRASCCRRSARRRPASPATSDRPERRGRHGERRLREAAAGRRRRAQARASTRSSPAVRANCRHHRRAPCAQHDDVHVPARDARAVPLGAGHRARSPCCRERTWAPGSSEREAQWDALEHGDYLPLPVRRRARRSLSTRRRSIASLVPPGWVYGAGIGRFGKPQFFLAELEREEWRDGVRVLVARARARARPRARPGGAARRHDLRAHSTSLRRLLWERADAVDARQRRRSAQVPRSMPAASRTTRCPRWSGWSTPKPRR